MKPRKSGRRDQDKDLPGEASDSSGNCIPQKSAVPESRICSLIPEHEHKTHNYTERWYDAARNVEVPINVVVDVDNKCCQKGVNKDWK